MALGLLTAEARHRVYFTTAADLVTRLTKAHTDGRLQERMRVFLNCSLLIVDEIGRASCRERV